MGNFEMGKWMNQAERVSQNYLEWLLKRVNWLVFILFLLLTVIAGWSVLTRLDTVIIGDDNDVYINPWADWWTVKALQEPDIQFWYTDFLFYPQGVNLNYHSFSHLNTLVSLFLRSLLDDLPAYNLAILINYALSGFAMFQLARYMTNSIPGSILAGIVFAFNSHALYQSSHPVLVSIWCFPWATLYFLRAARENRVKMAMFAAVFVFLGALSSTLLLILLAMWFGFLIIYLFLARDWPRSSWKILVVFIALCLVGTLPLIYPLLREAVSNSNSSFWIDPGSSISTDIFSIFVPHWYIWLIRGLYFGIVPFYLVMLAFKFQRREARVWFLLLIVAYLFAIGPNPHFGGRDWGITLPWSLLAAPLLRNMYRVNILMSLGLAMIVAYGWLGMSTQLMTAKARTIAAVIVIAATFGEYTAVPFPSTSISVSSFYTAYLEDVPDDIALAILPTGRQEDKRYLYYQTLHGHRMTGGVISRPSDNVFDFILDNPLLRAGAVDLAPVPIPADPQPALRALSDAGVGYLVLDKVLMDVIPWREALPMTPVFEDDLTLVYATGP